MSSDYRKVSNLHVFLNAAATNATGEAMEVADYQNVVVTVTATNATVFFQGSIQDAEGGSLSIPNFAASSSVTNQWSFVNVVDYQDDSKLPGNTGIAFTTAATRTFEFNTNGLSWVNMQITGNTGTVTARAKGYSTQ